MVKVTLMSSDGSWQGGEAVFEYIDDPPTFEEFLSMVVTVTDKRCELFKRMDKQMSSNRPSDGQTTDSCGKTAPGKFFTVNLSSLTYAIVAKKLIKKLK